MTTIENAPIHDRLRALAVSLESEGRVEDARDLRALLGWPTETLSTGDAASLLDVTQQSIVRWIKQGILIGSRVGDGGNWTVDAASVAACRARRIQLDAARAAFVGGSELDQAAFIAGVSPERLAALAEDDD